MGSFNLKCSVTRLTITPGDEVYLQFMVPSIEGEMRNLYSKKYRSPNEEDSDTFPNKDLKFSGTLSKWVPYGPAIPAVYDDYGRVELIDSQECKEAVEVLEVLTGGIPFKSLMLFGSVDSTDSRFTVFKQGQPSLEDWQSTLCTNVAYTCIHSPVYKEMIKPNFVVEEYCSQKERIKRVDLVKKQSAELIDILNKDGHVILNLFNDIRDVKDGDYLFGLVYLFTAASKYLQNNNESGPADLAALQYKIMDRVKDIKVLQEMTKDILPMYLRGLCLLESSHSLDWFYDTHYFINSMYGMDLDLQTREYGNQGTNWKPWRRLFKSVSYLK